MYLDNRFWCHPKLVVLSDKAFRVWVSGCSYSAGFGLRGRLRPEQQRTIGSTPRVRHELIAGDLWDADGDDVVIHDWGDYNGAQDAGEARRRADRERKRRKRAADKSADSPAGPSRGGALSSEEVSSEKDKTPLPEPVPVARARVRAPADGAGHGTGTGTGMESIASNIQDALDEAERRHS
jgi:hypothetical protein